MRTLLGMLLAAVMSGGAFAGVATASGAFERDFAAVATATWRPAPAGDDEALPDASCGPVEIALVMPR